MAETDTTTMQPAAQPVMQPANNPAMQPAAALQQPQDMTWIQKLDSWFQVPENRLGFVEGLAAIGRGAGGPGSVGDLLGMAAQGLAGAEREEIEEQKKFDLETQRKGEDTLSLVGTLKDALPKDDALMPLLESLEGRTIGELGTIGPENVKLALELLGGPMQRAESGALVKQREASATASQASAVSSLATAQEKARKNEVIGKMNFGGQEVEVTREMQQKMFMEAENPTGFMKNVRDRMQNLGEDFNTAWNQVSTIGTETGAQKAVDAGAKKFETTISQAQAEAFTPLPKQNVEKRIQSDPELKTKSTLLSVMDEGPEKVVAETELNEARNQILVEDLQARFPGYEIKRYEDGYYWAVDPKNPTAGFQLQKGYGE